MHSHFDCFREIQVKRQSLNNDSMIRIKLILNDHRFFIAMSSKLRGNDSHFSQLISSSKLHENSTSKTYIST